MASREIASPKPNDTVDDTVDSPLVKHDIPSNKHRDSRWFLFRQLCKYYVECLKIQENHKVAIYLDKLEQNGVMLSGRYDLRAISAGEPCTTPETKTPESSSPPIKSLSSSSG